MSATKYNRELKRILDDKSPAIPTNRSREDIAAAIVQVSDALKGPLSNTERLLLVADRQDLRKQLAAAQ